MFLRLLLVKNHGYDESYHDCISGLLGFNKILITLSDTIVDIVIMNCTSTISKANHSAIHWTIQSKAWFLNSCEVFNYISCLYTETLGSLLITCSSNYQILVRDKSDNIYNWVNSITILCHIPRHVFYTLWQLSHIPKLDTFSKGSTTCDNIVIISRNINSITINLNFSSNLIH